MPNANRPYARTMRTNELARELREVSRLLRERPNGYAVSELVRRDAGELIAEAAHRLEDALDALVALERLPLQREGHAGGVFAPDGHELASGAGDAAGDASAGFDRALGEGRR